MSKLLVDTNVFVYGIDQDSKYFTQSRKVLDSQEHQLFTTSKNLLEFLSVVTRKSGYNLNPEVALEISEEIKENLNILYPDFASMEIFYKLMKIYKPTGLLVHDLEIASIGLASGINKIASFNRKDFKTIEEISLIDF